MSNAEVIEFRPPPATVGTQVVWYRHGRKRRQDATIGYVIHSGSRTATIYLCNGRRVDAVRHVNDPKLNLSVEQREQGAWDFTDDHYTMQEYRREMDRRVSDLERQVTVLINKDAKPDSPKKRRGNPNASECLKEYRELQKKAKDLGIKTANMKKHQIQDAIAQSQVHGE